MLNSSDKAILQKRGITIYQIEEQLKAFVNGFPFLIIKNAAELQKGIVLVTKDDVKANLKQWDEYLQTEATIIYYV